MEGTRYQRRYPSLSRTFPAHYPPIKTFTHRIIVAGSRNWDDEQVFKQVMLSYLKDLHDRIDYCFISGKARTGADALVIRLVKPPYLCYEFPAHWDELGKAAGHIRNAEMADHGTHLICFWDGQSKGTLGMIKDALRKLLKVHVFRFDSKDTIVAQPIETIEDLYHGW